MCIVFNLSDSFNPCHKLKHTLHPKFYVSTFPVITFKQLTDSLHTVNKMQRDISICLIKITPLPVMHMTTTAINRLNIQIQRAISHIPVDKLKFLCTNQQTPLNKARLLTILSFLNLYIGPRPII